MTAILKLSQQLETLKYQNKSIYNIQNHGLYFNDFRTGHVFNIYSDCGNVHGHNLTCRGETIRSSEILDRDNYKAFTLLPHRVCGIEYKRGALFSFRINNKLKITLLTVGVKDDAVFRIFFIPLPHRVSST